MEEKELKTYGDLIKFIEENNLQDKKIVIMCEGYNSDFYITNGGSFGFKEDNTISIAKYNDNVVLSDSCGFSSYDRNDFDLKDKVLGAVCSFYQWFLMNEDNYKGYVTYDSIDDFLESFLEDDTDQDIEEACYDTLTKLINDSKEKIQQRLDKKEYRLI